MKALSAPIVTPEPKMICSQEGTMVAISGLRVTSIARPTEVETITALRLSRISTLPRV